MWKLYYKPEFTKALKSIRMFTKLHKKFNIPRQRCHPFSFSLENAKFWQIIIFFFINFDKI
jgi:hypothetical protein